MYSRIQIFKISNSNPSIHVQHIFLIFFFLFLSFFFFLFKSLSKIIKNVVHFISISLLVLGIFRPLIFYFSSGRNSFSENVKKK